MTPVEPNRCRQVATLSRFVGIVKKIANEKTVAGMKFLATRHHRVVVAVEEAAPIQRRVWQCIRSLPKRSDRKSWPSLPNFVAEDSYESNIELIEQVLAPRPSS